jgi:hypothetical protein
MSAATKDRRSRSALPIVTVTDVHVVKMMCGDITCSHCGHRQSAEAYHHERDELPLKDYAVRCNACGQPFPLPESAGH